QAATDLRDALNAVILNQDLDTAEQKLQRVERLKLIAPLEALRCLTQALIRLQRGQNKEALDDLNKAHTFQPDMPVVDLLKSTVYNRLGQPDKALKHVEAYRDLLGEDDPVCLQRGEALRELHRFAEAAQSYRKSLDFNPKNADSFLGLIRSLEWEANRDDLG